MTKLKLPLAIQGWVLVLVLIGFIALVLSSPLREMTKTQTDRSELQALIDRYQIRLEALPSQIITETPSITARPDTDQRVQQELSSALRGSGARLLTLSANETIDFKGMSASQWRATVEGDPIAVENTLKALSDLDYILIADMQIEAGRGRNLTTDLRLLRPSQELQFDAEAATLPSFYEANPFDIQRLAFQRAEPRTQRYTLTVSLIGVTRKNGEWLAVLDSPELGEKLVKQGDSYGSWDVAEVGSGQVMLTSADRESQTLTLF